MSGRCLKKFDFKLDFSELSLPLLNLLTVNKKKSLWGNYHFPSDAANSFMSAETTGGMETNYIDIVLTHSPQEVSWSLGVACRTSFMSNTTVHSRPIKNNKEKKLNATILTALICRRWLRPNPAPMHHPISSGSSRCIRGSVNEAFMAPLSMNGHPVLEDPRPSLL